MQEVDHVTSRIIGAAIRVHRKYGPGLLESVYTACLGHELVAEGLHIEVEKPLSLQHEGLIIHRVCILDLLVEEQVIVEVKCVSKIAPIHVAQLRTYLKLTGLQVSLIINFNVTRLVDGVKRVVNDYVDDAPIQCAPSSSEQKTKADDKKGPLTPDSSPPARSA